MSVSPRTAVRRLLPALLSFALTCTLTLSIVRAAPAESRAVDLAREAYVTGVEAAKSERSFDAVEHFRHSYELSHTTAALYNLGVALRAPGRHREARDTFTILLKDGDKLDSATRDTAAKLLADARQRVVELHI